MFSGEVSPCEIFASDDEGQKIIQCKVEELEREGRVRAWGAGLENTAVAELWKDPAFDKSPWFNKVAEGAHNIVE
jgi:hypothetical protein